MNKFLYEASVIELKNCKYIKDLEVLLRKYNNLAKYVFSSGARTDTFEIRKYKYKLYSLAYNLFVDKSKSTLPDFLSYDLISLQKGLLFQFQRESDHPIRSYEEFIDVFEFDKVVETPNDTNNNLEVLHNCILDKPIHFEFKFNQQLTSFERYSTDLYSASQSYLQAINLKQTLSEHTPSTVLDAYLVYTKGLLQVTDPRLKSLDGRILKLQQQTKALQTLNEYAKSLPEEVTNEQ